MKILLLGYGKMGRTIEQIAQERGHTIAGRIDISNRSDMDLLSETDVDVAIEFSSPEAAVENIAYCIKRGWAVVSGTTGWLNERTYIEELAHTNKGAFFYASNYSIGVNLFFRLNRYLARLMNGQPYDVKMEEIHHIHKKDEPSGTGITLAEGIIAETDGMEGWVLAPENRESHVPITSVREGEVPGTHIVRYDSEIDTIEIAHIAHGRKGFALGAVVAAEWLKGKEGLFGMDDLLREVPFN